MQRDAGRLLLATVVCIAALAGPIATAGATPQDAADDTIDVTYTVDHVPEGPTIEVTMRASMPDRVTALTTRLPPGVEVTGTDGFTGEDGAYEWDGETETPTIEYTVPAGGTTLLTESYASIQFARVVGAVGYRYSAPEVSAERHVEIDGQGVVHGYVASLWEDATTRESADGTTIHAVTPPTSGSGAVEADADRQRTVAERLAAVDAFFGFDRTDDHIVAFVRPSGSGGLAGPVAGQANSAGQILLEADSATDRQLLAHEWTHTQQDFRTTAATNWFVEGSADYYGYYYAHHAGGLDFETFRQRLNVRGSQYADTDLRALSNASEPADYRKGRHVAAGLDATIRERSEGDASLANVLVALRARDGGNPRYGDGAAVSTSELVELSSDAAGSSVESYYLTATGPQAPPALPSDPAAFAHEGTVAGTPVLTTPAESPTSSSPSDSGALTDRSGGDSPSSTATATTRPTGPTATPGQLGFGVALGGAAMLVAVVLLVRKR